MEKLRDGWAIFFDVAGSWQRWLSGRQWEMDGQCKRVRRRLWVLGRE